jgi:hypothetical protein
MNKYEALLEPFETHTLTAIRAAFQAGWDELYRKSRTPICFCAIGLSAPSPTLPKAALTIRAS